MKAPIYSPGQVACSAFFGGPMAAVYVLKKNYDALGNERDSRRMLVTGTILIVILLGLLPFLPDKFPNMAIPIAYVLSAAHVASKFQMLKKAIVTSPHYQLRSGLNVLGVSAGWFVVFMVVFIAEVLLLDYCGINLIPS